MEKLSSSVNGIKIVIIVIKKSMRKIERELESSYMNKYPGAQKFLPLIPS